MNIEEFIKASYNKVGLKKLELVSSTQNGYIGKNTYVAYLNDGTTKKVDQITKNGDNGDAVMVVPLTNDGKILAILESRPLTKSGINLSFPAGMVDDGEEPMEAAIRELREETGYEAEKLIPLEWHYQDQGCSKAVMTTFLGVNCVKKYDKELGQSERIEILEITMEDIEREINNPDNDNFKDSGSKIAYYTLKMRK